MFLLVVVVVVVVRSVVVVGVLGVVVSSVEPKFEFTVYANTIYIKEIL